MKKCPYCAEEIQGEATVCRFCGRDQKKPPSTWAVIGVVFLWLIMAGLMSMVGGQIAVGLGLYDMACATPAVWGTLILGLIINWKTPRLRNGFFIFFALYFGGFGLFGLIMSQSPAPFYPTPWPTRNPLPTPWSTKQYDINPVMPRTPTLNPCTPAIIITPASAGRTLCVYGNLTRQQFLPYNGTVRLYLSESPPFFLLCEQCFYHVKIGDCLTARGLIELTTDHQPFINLHRQDLDYCR